MQIAVWRFFKRKHGSDVLNTKRELVILVFIQYVPRFFRFLPIISDLKKTAGVFAETAWAGAAYYLLWFTLASHVSSSTDIKYFFIYLNIVHTVKLPYQQVWNI